MTASEFAERRHELPDGGRWTELVGGQLKTLHPPDEKHGNVVLNLSKAVADVLTPESESYVAFEVGLQTRRDPDTVRLPAMCVFSGGDRFGHLDFAFVMEIPALVLEVVSTRDRRTTMAERVFEYHALGVEKVWIADPVGEVVTVLRRNSPALTFSGDERLTELALLPGLELQVTALFAEPSWWRGKR